MIHACGQVDLVDNLGFSPGVVAAGRTALQNGAPILCDAEMVASGVTRARLPAVTMSAPCATPGSPASRLGSVPPAAPLHSKRPRDRLGGAVVAIGNAPTALFHLLDMLDAGAPRLAAVLGIPVGFIGAAESKAALAAALDFPDPRRRRPSRRVRHHGGGAQRAGFREGDPG